MKISTKGRYALRLMIDVAVHGGEEFVSLKDVAARQGISMKYLEQIQWDTVFDCAEGTLYVEFCPDCQIVSMQHQQT